MAKTSSFSSGTMRSFRRAAMDINTAMKKIKHVEGPAYRMIGEEIMTDVKDSRPGQGVPVDKGTLRDTGRVDGGDNEKKPVTLSFGGAAAPYALIQHEVLKFRHKLGEARYLVRGLERWRPASSAAYAYLKGRVTKIMGGQ